MRANKKNTDRQPQRAMIMATMIGVTAPPKRDAPCVTPCANPRSSDGIQWENARVAVGNAPASPTPNNSLITNRDAKLQARAVAAVISDQKNTIAARTLRGPYLSLSMPIGIWHEE